MPRSPFHPTHSHSAGSRNSTATTSCHRCNNPVHKEYFPHRAPDFCDPSEILTAVASVNTPIFDEVFRKTPGMELPSGSSSLTIDPKEFRGRPAITLSMIKFPHNEFGPIKVAYPIQLLLLSTFKGSTQESLPTVLQRFCIPIFFNKPIIDNKFHIHTFPEWSNSRSHDREERSTWLIAREFEFVGHINRWWRNVNKSKSHMVSSFCLEPAYHAAVMAQAKLLWEQWVAECQENEGFAKACLLEYEVRPQILAIALNPATDAWQNKMREARRVGSLQSHCILSGRFTHIK